MVPLTVFIFCILLILLSSVSRLHSKSLPISAPHAGYVKAILPPYLVLLYTSIIPLDLVKVTHFRPVPFHIVPFPTSEFHTL